MGTPTQVCMWSCPNFSAPAGRLFRTSTPVYVDSESSTQADGAQSSRVPMPFPEDPYDAIRQVYLDGTDTEFEPFEDPTDTETPESPLAIAPPKPLSESTPPILFPILRRTACIAVRVPHAMSSGLSASMAEVAAMSESALRKRFRSSCESSLSVSPPDLPLRKRYREDEGPTAEDDDPTAEDEGLTVGVESPDMDDEGYGLDDEGHGRDDESHSIDDEGHSVESDGLGLEEEEEAVPGGQQQAARVVGMTVSAPLGLGYAALRRRELALEESNIYSMFEVGQGFGSAPVFERPERVSAFRQPTLTTWTDPEDGMIYIDIPDYPSPAPPVQTPPSIEWTSGSLSISPSPSDDPSPISSPMTPLTLPSPIATPAAVETEGFLTELGAQVQIDIEVEAWAGQTDAQREAIWHAISDVQGENQDLRLQLAEERRARLELAEVVDGMRRGQEPEEEGIRLWMVAEIIGKSYCDRFGNLIIRLTVFWNGLPWMGKAEMVNQARFAWGFLSVEKVYEWTVERLSL
ncbi:hypothetical protein Tco_0812649 [Tanacetum coccineum]